MFIKRTPSIQVGLWLRHHAIDVVWFDKDNRPHSECLEKLDLLELPVTLNRRLAMPARRKSPYKFITAIMPHHIWQKTLILPHNLTPLECEQQCHFTLSNELPLPLEEIWYDYAATPLKQGFRLEIFAIRQQIATDYLQQFMPLQIEVLDNMAKALLRGAEYVLGKPLPASAIFLYQDEQGGLAVQPKLQQNQTLFQTETNLTALFEQYCHRYDEKPEAVFYLQTEDTETAVPDHWHCLSTELPLIALGNALWQQDTYAKSTALFDAPIG